MWLHLLEHDKSKESTKNIERTLGRLGNRKECCQLPGRVERTEQKATASEEWRLNLGNAAP